MRSKKNYLLAVVLLVCGVLGLSGCQSEKYQPIQVEDLLGTKQQTAEGTVETGASSESSVDGSGAETAAGGAAPETLAGSAPVTMANGIGALPETMASTKADVYALSQDPLTETDVVFEERKETVYVIADTVNIRSAASTNSAKVTTVSRGTKLTRTGISERWSRIELDGQAVYIASEYVSTAAPVVETQTGDDAVTLNPSWKYAEFSKINSGSASLYHARSERHKGITVCVNAGHGTQGGSNIKTLCHPDGTAKVTGGTTAAGATTAVAVSGGMTFSDGTAEAKVTLALAKVLKEKLLAQGYDVLMIRETDDVQLDNIARTIIANQMADCHIALHWDSTTSDKGAFYMSVPNVNSYRSMEPVASNWQKHHALGEQLLAGLRNTGVKIWSDGSLEMDLTQTSFSTIPSIDIELGDKVSDHSAAALDRLGDGLVSGVDQYFSR